MVVRLAGSLWAQKRHTEQVVVRVACGIWREERVSRLADRRSKARPGRQVRKRKVSSAPFFCDITLLQSRDNLVSVKSFWYKRGRFLFLGHTSSSLCSSSNFACRSGFSVAMLGRCVLFRGFLCDCAQWYGISRWYVWWSRGLEDARL